jgi:hypothetical protein
MAAFATLEACETRAYAKVVDKTWTNAHAQRGYMGTLGVRVQRPLSPTHPDYGAWVEITDDATA